MIAVWRAWPHLPRAVQRHAQIAAAINIPLYLLACSPGELRDLSSPYTVFPPVVASNLGEWIGNSETARTRHASPQQIPHVPSETELP